MSDKENILLDPAEMDKIENIPEIKTVSEEDLPAESEVKEQFEEKPAPTASPDYTDAVPEASKPEHIGERSVCSFDALIQKILDGERQYDLSKIVSAYELAEKYHHNQKRESGEPYITHPLSVAYILLELGMDTDTICAALLHDVVEDTPCTLEELQKNFGSDVAMLVNGVTKLKKVETFTKDEQKAENIRKILLAMSEDIRVIIIKLADRLHNMRTLNYCKDSKRRTIAHETMNIYAPIAHRLGIRSIKDEFEDNSYGIAIIYLVYLLAVTIYFFINTIIAFNSTLDKGNRVKILFKPVMYLVLDVFNKLFTAALSELHLLVYLGISIWIKIVKSKIFKFIFN